MICTCVYCLYTFEADELPVSCPDCGKGPVREATHDEQEQYEENRNGAFETTMTTE